MHKHLSISDLEWMLYPPVILNQYKLYRNEDGIASAVALWAYLNEEAEQKLKVLGKLSPQDWGNSAVMDKEKGLVKVDGGTLWLVDLIAPFHTEQNQQRQQVLAALMEEDFKGKKFKMMHVNPETGARELVELDGK